MLRSATRRFLVVCVLVVIIASLAAAQDFTVSPATVSFPSQVLNTTSPTAKTVTVTAASSLPAPITITATPSGDFSVSSCPSPLNAGDKCTLSVTFTPTALGTRTGSLAITDGTTNATVALSGTGITATSLAPTSLSFGNVVQNTLSASKTIKLTNNQDVPLTGITVSPSNSDYAVGGCAADVPARSYCTLTVIFAPTAAPVQAENASLLITHSAVTSPQTVALSGTSVAPISLSVSSLTFSSLTVGSTSAAKTVTLKNNQLVDLSSVALTTSGDFAASGCAGIVAAGGTCTISVTFSPTAVGPAAGLLRASSPDALNTPTATLSGAGAAPVTATPSSVSFGNVTVGSTSAGKTVTIKNAQTGQTLGLNGISVSGDFARKASGAGTDCANFASLGPLASCTVALTFTPTVGGASSGALTVNHNAPGSPTVVALSGTGTTPVTISPKSLSFGNVSVGLVSAGKLVTLQNNQTVPLNFGPISVSGDFLQQDTASTATTCGAQLAVGASCTISLVGAPTIGGVRNGLVVINDDTSSSPHAVPLKVTGINAVTVGPTSLTFAGQMVGTTSITKGVTLTNHQTIPATFTTSVTGPFAESDICGGTILAGGTCVLAETFTPTATGTQTGSLSISYSGGAAPLTVSLSGTGTASNPPAVITNVAPGAGTLGTTVNGVLVTGLYTQFQNGTQPTKVSFGAGVTVSNVVVLDDTHLTADVTISSSATPGARIVTVKNGTVTASLKSGFVVSASTALSFSSITPNAAAQGQSLNVEITGDNTHFQQGTTYANFGQGIVVNGALQVLDATHAIANITVSATTALGWRMVTAVTGGEYAVSSPQGFDVLPSNAALVSITPAGGQQGSIIFPVTITGANTHFLQNATQVSLGAGVNVGNTTVIDATHLQMEVAIAAAAAPGVRDVMVTTGGETETLPAGFTVTAAALPYLANVSPTSGQQGQNNILVTITGANTNFQPGDTITFGGGIVVNSFTVSSTTTAVADISIPLVEDAIPHTAQLSSGGSIFTFTFVVTRSAASIVSLVPSAGPQGAAVSVDVTGSNTHWDQATTTVVFLPVPYPAVIVNRVTVQDAQHLRMDLTIPANTTPGPQPLQIATGGEVLYASFGVYADTPTLTMSPSNSMPGKTVSVSFTGEFTHFNPATTTAVIDGTGVALQNFTVTSPTSATAQLVVAPDAPLSPPAHTITLTTPVGSGEYEILTSSFAVYTTPAVLLAITPYHALPGTTFPVTITGANTHFAPGVTTLGFGPNISVSNVVVNSATELTATASIDSGAALGWRNAYVNTGTEQLTIGFHIDNPVPTPMIAAVSPSSGAQGQSMTVTINGQNTHWVQGTSELILGAGVTVADLVVNGPTSATATIAIAPTAPLGGSSVIMITGTEIASGQGFSVTGGPAQIISVSPNTATQNQTLTLAIVGQGTHWLQGGSSLDLGPGVIVDQLAIVDPQHAFAQVTVLSTASLGFHTAAMSTDGEYAPMSQALNIVQGTAALLSSSPNAGPQGTSLAVQVLGRYTHWQTGFTTASYGEGITVDWVSVVDSVSAFVFVTVNPTAYVDVGTCHSLTMTTVNGAFAEQVSLPSQLCITQGAAVVTNVNPNLAPQGSTLTVQVTGQNTHWQNGLTVADFGAGINAGNVIVTSPTTASVDLGVTSSATNGYHTVTMRTLGEYASLPHAFTVGPITPTLNGVAPYSGQQGQSLNVTIIGQYTHFAQGVTTATFGQGITVGNVNVVDNLTVTADLTIDALAFTGTRTVTLTTGGEIVSGNLFTVTTGPAIISQVTPSSGNQGQEIVLNITGQDTHWAQGVTHFAMPGLGYDISVVYFVVNSPTSATADIRIAPTAGLGPRSIYMVTGGEALTDTNAFVITGGIPSILSVSPNSANAGTNNLNVQITGGYTQWTTASTTVDFGPGITVQTFTVNNSTSITAVINIDTAAQTIGYHTVSARTGTQVLESSFQVTDPNIVPTPYISYFWPGSGLPGQTFTITIAGQYTHWDPNPANTQLQIIGGPCTSTATCDIAVNSFQVTSPTSARANITIDPAATQGTRTFQIVTGTELEEANFSIVIAQPVISIVDPSSGMQGATLDVNVIGQYTTFDNTTTFNFGSGITVNSVTVLGPTAATVNISVAQLATLGGRSVTATTGGQTVSGGYFSVTASLATIVGVSPNTAKQGDTVTVTLTGEYTHWDNTTLFTFGSGIHVMAQNVTSPTSADVTISIDPYAYIGGSGITAQTQGEVAHSLNNAFVVQPGTPIILSSGPGSGQQQQQVTLTVLGQLTNWVQGTTQVSYGNGVDIVSVTVTSPVAMTVVAHVQPTAYTGYRALTVTTGTQVLTLPYAFYVTYGPAAIAQLNPASGGQGHTLDVAVTGANTNFAAGITTANFGPGITANTVTVSSATSATVNITIAANATPGQNTVSLSTLGEVASAANAFTIEAATPTIYYANPTTGAQGQTEDVTLYALFTNWDNTTQFSFGAGITVNSATVTSATQATVNITVSPVATTGVRVISATTGGVTVTGTNLFAVVAGPAYISAVNPNSGQQNQNGLQIVVSGYLTHFTGGTPSLSFGPGVTVTSVQVLSDTNLTATVNISPSAPVQTNDVTVTTLGEFAKLTGGFTVQSGSPVVTSASPNSAHQNDTLDVVVNGLYTHWVNGTTTASFGAGITVNSVSVTSATQATVNISIDPAATVGSRTVTMTTNPEVAPGVGVFSVLAGLPQMQSVSPNTGAQGSTQTVTITGLFTHFQAGVSQVSFSGSGVTVGTVTVNGPTQLQVPVTVTPGAAAGGRTVTVTTGAETVSLANGFTVQPGQPAITVINPNVGVPNSTVSVAITGQFTNFVNGVTQANFGAGISVNGAAQGAFGTIAVSSATTATVTLTIDAAAALGPRNVTVQTNAEVLDVNAGFTVQSATPTPATVSAISPASNATGVPINTAINIQFSAPLDRTTVNNGNIRLVDTVLQTCYNNNYTATIPGTVSVDASGRVVTFTPAAVLNVGRQYQTCINYGQSGTAQSIKDASGNSLSYWLYNFTAGFAPDNSGPAFVTANLAPNDTGVPLNAPVILQFSKAIDPITQPLGFTVQTGGVDVAGTFGYTADYKQVTFTPSPPLSASTVYTVSYTSALEDSVGNPLSNPGSFSFTTGTASDGSAPQFVAWTPKAGEVTGLTPTISATFDELINPAYVTPAYVQVVNQATGAAVPGLAASLSADRKTITITLPRPLDPETAYSWRMWPYDRVGNGGYGTVSFVTGTGADVTPPTVNTVSPPSGATDVPVNATIQARMSEAIDGTVPPTFTLNPPVATTYAIASDNQTVTFALATLLSPSTTYTATLSGLQDTSGNAMAPYSWSFTTSASGTADTSHGSATIVPASGATNVPTNAQVVVSLSKPVNPATVRLGNSLEIFDNSIGKHVAGSLAISADYQTLTFTPSPAFGALHQICIWAGYNAGLYDWAGNSFNAQYQCFTTASTADITPPTVISVTPFAGATGIGPNNPVTLIFSKPLNPATVNNSTVAVFQGSTYLGWGPSLSNDATSITFTNGLAYGATYTVVVSPAVTDLAGNALAAEFASSFTTMSQPNTSAPAVTAFRPGAGATNVSPNTELTFFISEPLNPTTVYSSVLVSVNGALITGNVAATANDQVVTFTPSAPLQLGSLVQVWFMNSATDVAGNPLGNYQASFTVAPDLSTTPPQMVSNAPARYSSGNPTNSFVEVAFNKPMDPSTVNASSFYVLNSSSQPVAGSLALLNGNTALRFTPSAALGANTYYYVYLTAGLADVNGLAFAGTNYYFYTGAGPDNTTLAVTAIVPTNGATNIGVNALVRVTFSKHVDTATVTPDTLSLTAGGNPIPYTFSSADNSDGTRTLTVVPQAPLPASAAVTVSATGAITDYTGQALPPASATFTTQPGPDFSAAYIVASTINNGDTNVPINSVFTITYDRPMDTRTCGGYLYDYVWGYLPITLSNSSDARQLTVAPTAALSVNRHLTLYANCSYDLTGNAANSFSASFYTALYALTGGPNVVAVSVINGQTNVPVNFAPMVRFDRSIARPTASNITLLGNGTPVPLTPGFANADTTVTLTPPAILQTNTSYVLTITGVTDAAGAAMSAPVVISFTTGPSIDAVAPTLVSYTPINNSTTGTTPVIRMRFNKPLDPVRSSGAYLYDRTVGAALPGVAVTYSTDMMTINLTYPGALDASTNYQVGTGNFCGLSGFCNSTYWVFTTGTGPDTTAPTVIASTPPAGAVGVPINALISLQMSEPIDPTSLDPAAITVAPSAPGTVQLSPDGMTLTYALTGQLASNTLYTLSVAAGAFADLSGNAVAPYATSFTTSSVVDSVHGTISLTSPAPGSTGVPVNTTITVTLSEPVDPVTVVPEAFVVYECPVSGCVRISGSISVGANGGTLTFTPTSQLPPSTQIQAYVGYYVYLRDLAGNTFNYLYNANFTTAATPDTVLPQVISVTPADTATDVGPNAVVTLTFSESIDPNTINSSYFGVFQGYTRLNVSIGHSADNRTVTLAATWPYGATLTVFVSSNVDDLEGNTLGTPFLSTFTTIPYPVYSTPSVTQMRPGSGATGVPLDSVITLYASATVNAASLSGAVTVVQNGVIFPGTLTLAADGQSVVFTPASPFAGSALIEVYATPLLTDIYGNSFSSYGGSFRTAADLSATAPSLVNTVPSRYSSNNPTNTLIEAQFNKAINPATVNSSTFYVRDNTNTAVAGTISLLNGNTVLRFTPSAPLAASTYDYVYLTSGLQDVNGFAFAGTNFYFYTGTGPDTTLPAVASIVPTNGSTSIGDNTSIRFSFSKYMDTLTINPTTVTLQSGATSLPYSISFSNSNNVTNVALTPQAPLPDNATITLTLSAGINDTVGNAIAPQTVSFQTGNGPDFAAPQVIYASLAGLPSNAIVPVNTSFTFVYNKPLDPTTVYNSSGSTYLYDYSVGYLPATVTLSADGRTVTMVPTSNLTPGHRYYVRTQGYDLNGNGPGAWQSNPFYAGSTTDSTPPEVSLTTPNDGQVGVATNTVIEADFNEPVDGTSLGQITMLANGSPVPITPSLTYSGNSVRLMPSSLLQPSTTYTVTVTGVRDIAGNAMSAPYTFSFTTGLNVWPGGTQFSSATMQVGGVATQLVPSGTVSGVDIGSTIQLAFSAPIEVMSIVNRGAYLMATNTSAAVPVNVAISTDGKTVTLTPTSALTNGTQYTLYVNYSYGAVYDQALYGVVNGAYFYFTTAP